MAMDLLECSYCKRTTTELTKPFYQVSVGLREIGKDDPEFGLCALCVSRSPLGVE